MHAYIRACKHACMQAYIHTFIHTYTHTYIHTGIHTYRQTGSGGATLGIVYVISGDEAHKLAPGFCVTQFWNVMGRNLVVRCVRGTRDLPRALNQHWPTQTQVMSLFAVTRRTLDGMPAVPGHIVTHPRAVLGQPLGHRNTSGAAGGFI